jgi:hypothetical protein
MPTIAAIGMESADWPRETPPTKTTASKPSRNTAQPWHFVKEQLCPKPARFHEAGVQRNERMVIFSLGKR